MIPKIIHYCWFGGAPLPLEAKKCIESWKRFCPGYELMEWNESNFDVTGCRYVREAYAAGKWAYVSDYARFHILYRYGGLYFDTDVELIKPIDELLKAGAFMGVEADDRMRVNPGLGIAALPAMPFYKEMLELYESKAFIMPNGMQDVNTVVDYTTECLERHGLINDDAAAGTIQKVADITIYPKEYFCPLNYFTGQLNITDKTYSIHHYTASWKTGKEQKWNNIEQKIRAKLGVRNPVTDNIIWTLTGYAYRHGMKACIKRIAEVVTGKA